MNILKPKACLTSNVEGSSHGGVHSAHVGVGPRKSGGEADVVGSPDGRWGNSEPHDTIGGDAGEAGRVGQDCGKQQVSRS